MTTDYDWWPAHGAPLTSIGSVHSINSDEPNEDDLARRGPLGFTFESKASEREGSVPIHRHVELISCSLTPAHSHVVAVLQQQIGRQMALENERRIASGDRARRDLYPRVELYPDDWRR